MDHVTQFRGLLFSVAFYTALCLMSPETFSQEITAVKLAVWGERGGRAGQFADPQSISVDPAGFLYIADTGNHRIQKLSSAGDPVAEIGGFGWEKEQFREPVDVSARNGLDVFIADCANGRIERYDKDLHYLATFRPSEAWEEHLRFEYPCSVCLSNQGELFCLDEENRRVLKLDVQGQPQISFGDFDAGEGRLLRPRRIFVTSADRVCVTDQDGGRVAVFDIHGNFLYTMGEGLLAQPLGMAEMSGARLVVADPESRCVLVFRPNGTIAARIGGEDSAVHFARPVDVACWRDRMYILDQSRCTVDVFRWTKIGDADSR